METHNGEWKQANGRLYAIAHRCRLTSDDIHATIYSAYGKTHTTELTPAQLNSLSTALQKRAMPEEEQKMDKMRKRVIGAVRRYCKVMGYRTDTLYLIQIIQRDGTKLNELSEAALMRKYNTFSKMARELEEMKSEN